MHNDKDIKDVNTDKLFTPPPPPSVYVVCLLMTYFSNHLDRITNHFLFSHLFSFRSHLSKSCVFTSKLVNLRFQFFEFFPHRHTLNCIYTLFFLLLSGFRLKNFTLCFFTRRLL